MLVASEKAPDLASFAEGSPATGPMFLTLRQPRKQLDERSVHNLMSRFARSGGIAEFDLRRLRLAFAWSVKCQGWG